MGLSNLLRQDGSIGQAKNRKTPDLPHNHCVAKGRPCCSVFTFPPCDVKESEKHTLKSSRDPLKKLCIKYLHITF